MGEKMSRELTLETINTVNKVRTVFPAHLSYCNNGKAKFIYIPIYTFSAL